MHFFFGHNSSGIAPIESNKNFERNDQLALAADFDRHHAFIPKFV